MRQSHVIEISGQFAGAAVAHNGRFRFIAVDPRVEELDDSIWPSLPDVQRVVQHLWTTGRLPPAARSGAVRAREHDPHSASAACGLR